MTFGFVLISISLISATPLLTAVAVAVLSADARRRADARRVVSLLRPQHPRMRRPVPQRGDPSDRSPAPAVNATSTSLGDQNGALHRILTVDSARSPVSHPYGNDHVPEGSVESGQPGQESRSIQQEAGTSVNAVTSIESIKEARSHVHEEG